MALDKADTDLKVGKVWEWRGGRQEVDMNLSQTEGEGLFLKCVSGIGLNPSFTTF